MAQAELQLLLCLSQHIFWRRFTYFWFGDESRIEFNRIAGEKVACEKGLVAGSLGHQAATAWLEHQP